MTAGPHLVVDVQNDFCLGGALAVPDGDAVVPEINRLIAAHTHVIVTQDWHPVAGASTLTVSLAVARRQWAQAGVQVT